MKKIKEKKTKPYRKVIFLVILAYFVGSINLGLGLVEMFLDMIVIIFIIDTLTKKPKKKKSKHCRFWKKCKLYNPKIKSCNEDEGFYGSKYAGCYRKNEKQEDGK